MPPAATQEPGPNPWQRAALGAPFPGCFPYYRNAEEGVCVSSQGCKASLTTALLPAPGLCLATAGQHSSQAHPGLHAAPRCSQRGREALRCFADDFVLALLCTAKASSRAASACPGCGQLAGENCIRMVLIALVQHDSSLRACRAQGMHEVRGSQSSALSQGFASAQETDCPGVCADLILGDIKAQPGAAAGDGEVTLRGFSLAGFVLNDKSFLFLVVTSHRSAHGAFLLTLSFYLSFGAERSHAGFPKGSQSPAACWLSSNPFSPKAPVWKSLQRCSTKACGP